MSVHLLSPGGWPEQVVAGYTTRDGGVSRGSYESLNLGDHVDDEARAVAANRAALIETLPSGTHVRWLRQVHGTRVVQSELLQVREQSPPEADAQWTSEPQLACAVLTADCLPVLLCSDDGGVVAAAHAGWRGLAAGVLACTVRALPVSAARLRAWLGPCIGACHFSIGEEVRDALIHSVEGDSRSCFREAPDGEIYADLRMLATLQLRAAGVPGVEINGACTVCDEARYFSYRRDGQTGRMAAFIARR